MCFSTICPATCLLDHKHMLRSFSVKYLLREPEHQLGLADPPQDQDTPTESGETASQRTKRSSMADQSSSQ